MTDNQIVDLLNVMARNLIPELRLEFYIARQPCVFVGHILQDGAVAFDREEVIKNNTPKNFAKLFKRRIKSSLEEMKTQTESNLEKLK
jgi:hypothetical protein